MAVLTSTGITFNDSTVLNSKYGIIPQSKNLTFYQASAPTGWTQVTTHNDKALRVVSGTGAGSGGTIAFSSAFPSVATPVSATVPVTITGLAGGPTTLDATMIPAHAHPVNAGGSFYVAATPGPTPAFTGSLTVAPGTTTGPTGGGLGHAHPATYTSASGPFSTTIDLRVQFVDMIICTLS